MDDIFKIIVEEGSYQTSLDYCRKANFLHLLRH